MLWAISKRSKGSFVIRGQGVQCENMRQGNGRDCEVVGLLLVLDQVFEREAQFQLTQLES